MKNKCFITHLLKTLAICGVVFLAGACSSDKDKGDGQLNLSIHGDLNISTEGGLRVIIVSTNSEWDYMPEEDVEWLTFDKGLNNTLAVRATKNDTEGVRTTQLTIFTDQSSKTINVVQEKTFVSPDSESIDTEGGVATFEVAETKSWEYTFEEDVNWLVETEKTAKSVKFTAEENYKTQRAVNIKFSVTLSNGNKAEQTVTVRQKANSNFNESVPTSYGYALTSSMQPDITLVGQDYRSVHTFMQSKGWDYSEHPNISTDDHHEGKHMDVELDEVLDQYVFKFTAHAGEFLDGDRGELKDRQRNEMKSRTGNQYTHMNGNYGEWQVLEWKMKIPAGFRPSNQFTHLHQLKGQEGSDIGSPVITLSARSNSDGSNKRIQVIHNSRAGGSGQTTIVDNIPLSGFEDEWVQIQTEMNYKRKGYFRIKITRIRDRAVLVDYENTNIDLWREGGCINIRNKFGIYRSYGSTLTNPETERPTNGIKDEDLWLGDFKCYLRNVNENPEAVND